MTKRWMGRSKGFGVKGAVGSVLAVAALMLMGVGCATTEEAPEPEPTPTGSEFDQGRVDEPEPEPETEQVPERPSLDLETVYFDFDKATIRDDARVVLRDNAEELMPTDVVVTIEGHCDERGSEEYNLALGERRANSVKRYLTNLGVASNRLRTISYGEAKPAVEGHTEAAWRWNRRAEFRVGG